MGAIAFGLVAVISALSITIWVESSLRRIPVFVEYPDRPAAASGTNWMLVGSDGRGDLSPQQQDELSTGGDLGSSRTDTILLVHIPHLGSNQPATMVSIPRDSYVDIPGYGTDKINAAFAEGGGALLAHTVEQATGLRLDHYAEIGFGGFGAIVDALGGVEICPPEPINDPLAGIDLAAGCQTLDGRNALGYVRSRARFHTCVSWSTVSAATAACGAAYQRHGLSQTAGSPARCSRADMNSRWCNIRSRSARGVARLRT